MLCLLSQVTVQPPPSTHIEGPPTCFSLLTLQPAALYSAIFAATVANAVAAVAVNGERSSLSGLVS